MSACNVIEEHIDEHGDEIMGKVYSPEVKDAMLVWLASMIAQFCHLYGHHTAYEDKELTALIQSYPSTQEILQFAEKSVLAPVDDTQEVEDAR